MLDGQIVHFLRKIISPSSMPRPTTDMLQQDRKALQGYTSHVDFNSLTEQFFIDHIRDSICLYHNEGVLNASGRYGFGFLQAYNILAKEAHMRHGGMPVRICDRKGDNFALSIEEYVEPLSFLDRLAKTPRKGIRINGCNSDFEKRYITVYDDGAIEEYNGKELGIVEKQLANNKESIIAHFNDNPEEHLSLGRPPLGPSPSSTTS